MGNPKGAGAADAETNQADGAAPTTYTLKQQHTHNGVDYLPGHEFTAEEWGLTEQQIGWLQGVGTI